MLLRHLKATEASYDPKPEIFDKLEHAVAAGMTLLCYRTIFVET